MKKRFSLKSQISQITYGHFLIIYVKAQKWPLFNVSRKISVNTIVFLQMFVVNLVLWGRSRVPLRMRWLGLQKG